jgi:hypothetical protein
MEPLQAQSKLLGILPSSVDLLFGNVKEIHSTNSSLLQLLDERFREEAENRVKVVGEVFIQYQASLKKAYCRYTVNCQQALDGLQKLKEKDKNFTVRFIILSK